MLLIQMVDDVKSEQVLTSRLACAPKVEQYNH